MNPEHKIIEKVWTQSLLDRIESLERKVEVQQHLITQLTQLIPKQKHILRSVA